MLKVEKPEKVVWEGEMKIVFVLRNYLTNQSISNFKIEDFKFFRNFVMKILAQKNVFLKVFEVFVVNYDLLRIKASPK